MREAAPAFNHHRLVAGGEAALRLGSEAPTGRRRARGPTFSEVMSS